MKIKKHGKVIEIGKVKKANWLGKFIGLMFSRRQKAEALLFKFRKPTKIKIHSYFVFFPFIAIWLDKENNVLNLKRVKPFNSIKKLKKPYSKLIEIPVNYKYKKWINLLDDI